MDHKNLYKEIAAGECRAVEVSTACLTLPDMLRLTRWGKGNNEKHPRMLHVTSYDTGVYILLPQQTEVFMSRIQEPTFEEEWQSLSPLLRDVILACIENGVRILVLDTDADALDDALDADALDRVKMQE